MTVKLTKAPSWLSAVVLCGLAMVVTVMPLTVRSLWPGSSAQAREPERGAPAAVLPEGTLGETVRVGNLLVSLAIAPGQPLVGQNGVDAFVTDVAGQPVKDARVTFDIDMTNMSHGPYLVDGQCLGNGHFTNKANFSMAGPWRVHVLIETPGQAALKARFTFRVNGA